MNLAELDELEAEVAQRGWRVRFQPGEVVGDHCAYLPDLLANGGTREEADGWAARLTALAKWKGYTAIQVVGPDLEPPDDGDPLRAALANVEALVQGIPFVEPPPVPTASSLPIRDGDPPEHLKLSLLSGSQLEDWCLVGSNDGGLYRVTSASLKDWTTSGRTVKWKMRKPHGTVLVGTEQVAMQPVSDEQTGLNALVGFHVGSGSWWTNPGETLVKE